MAKPNGNGKRHATQQSLNGAVKSICDIMRRSNCAGALQYVPELTWILFLRILDEREAHEAERAEAVGTRFTPSLKAPYRWRDWAAPDGAKRKELANATAGEVFKFVNGELLPHLKDAHSSFDLEEVNSSLHQSMNIRFIRREIHRCARWRWLLTPNPDTVPGSMKPPIQPAVTDVLRASLGDANPPNKSCDADVVH